MVGELLPVGGFAGDSGPRDQPGDGTTNRYGGIRNVRIIVRSIGMGHGGKSMNSRMRARPPGANNRDGILDAMGINQ